MKHHDVEILEQEDPNKNFGENFYMDSSVIKNSSSLLISIIVMSAVVMLAAFNGNFIGYPAA